MTNLSCACVTWAAIAAIGAGCSGANPYYCPGARLDNCLDIDASTSTMIDAAPIGCSDDHGCSGAAPVCDPASKICVQCAGSDDLQCTGNTPECGSDDRCHGCTMDAECASSLCLPDGACAAPGGILYVSPIGGATAACTVDATCSLAHALSLLGGSTTTIKLLPGTYTIVPPLTLGGTATLAGRGAVIKGTTGASGDAVVAAASGSVVQLDFVAITGGNGSGDGVHCTGATLGLAEVYVHDNGGIGVNTNGCAVVASRSTIASNASGGILIGGTGATFDLTNNFIDRNGTAASASGGVALGVASAGSNRLEFNTIVDNGSSTSSGGVVCNVAGLALPNNLIARNALGGSATAANAQTSGACTYPTSTVQNDTSGLAFAQADATPYDYHLMTGSTAIDHATTASTIVIDYDGDARPQGAADDQGADEYKP